jgi:hypothetical protein
MKRPLAILVSVLAIIAASATACSSSSVATSPLDGGPKNDSGTTGACASSPSATFELDVVGNAAFCDSSGCGASFLTIQREDGTPLTIAAGCVTSCDDCRPIACSGACRAPTTIGATGVTNGWDGTVYDSSTCGQGTTCAKPSCVQPGTYVAHMCGYAAVGDAGASSSICQASTTPTCADVTFTWPATGKITGTIGTR